MFQTPLYLAGSCRACRGPLETLLDLGSLCLSGFVAPGAPDPPRVPLDLTICSACDLVQLRHTTDPHQLYDQYWYRSGINEMMVEELRQIAQQAYHLTHCGPQDTVLDIGANDGTLLKQFSTPTKIAFEPADTFKTDLTKVADIYIRDFFPSRHSQALPSRSVKVITSIAMFYDLDDPLAFVQEVERLLTDDGLWIVQMQDLAQMTAATAFDNICHEHLCYYTPSTFANLLKQTKMAVRKVERRNINGGSLRFYVSKQCQRIPLGDTFEVSRLELEQFAHRVEEHRTQLQAAVKQMRDQHFDIDAYGASTKGNTLLQYCDFDRLVISKLVERSPEKVGLQTAGTRIDIVSEDTWRDDPAPVTLLPIWQFREGVLRREAHYLRRGGKFLIPLPHVELVEGGM